MTLAELLLDASADLVGVTFKASDGATEFRVGATVIAVATPDGAGEFRLDPAVAAAARRTPDTAASPRGPDWVRFAPAVVDDHAKDRSVAWLASAARRAGTG